MTSEIALIIGLAASILVTVAYIPEVVKTVRSKKTRDLSLSWLLALDTSQVLYLIYGLLTWSIPVAISSTSGVITVSILLAYKLKYKNR